MKTSRLHPLGRRFAEYVEIGSSVARLYLAARMIMDVAQDKVK
jgi:hypothetical protein